MFNQEIRLYKKKSKLIQIEHISCYSSTSVHSLETIALGVQSWL